jgi:hypothetical protein
MYPCRILCTIYLHWGHFKKGAITYVKARRLLILPGEPAATPASTSRARGLELAARMALERTQDVTRWSYLLGAVSGERVHLSWRRAVLLAPRPHRRLRFD